MLKELDRMTDAYLEYIQGNGDFYDIGMVEDKEKVVHYYNIESVSEETMDNLKEMADKLDASFIAMLGLGQITENEIDGDEMKGIIMILCYENTIYTMFQVFDEMNYPGRLVEFEPDFSRADFDDFTV